MLANNDREGFQDQNRLASLDQSGSVAEISACFVTESLSRQFQAVRGRFIATPPDIQWQQPGPAMRPPFDASRDLR